MLLNSHERRILGSITPIVVVSLLISVFFFPVVGGQSINFPSESDLGIHDEINDLMDEITFNRNSSLMLAETQMEIDKIAPYAVSKEHFFETEEGQDVAESAIVIPRSEAMVDTCLDTELADRRTVVDLILERPDEYFVYYKYDDQAPVWREGALFNLNLFDPFDPIALDWTFINVDNDPATGDAAGNDIAVRLKFEIRYLEITPASTTLIDIVLHGGLSMQTENLNPNAPDGDTVPLDIGVAKSLSFDDKDYIVMLQFGFFDRIPMHHSLSLLMNVTIANATVNLLESLLSGDFTGLSEDISNAISGPYIIEWGPSTTYTGYILHDSGFFEVPIVGPLFRQAIEAVLAAAGIDTGQGGRHPFEPLAEVDLMAAVCNVTSDESTGENHWKEVSWVAAHVDPDEDDSDGFLPGLGNLTLDTRSENTAFDGITWFYPEHDEGDNEVSDITADYFDAREGQATYVQLDIVDMPWYLKLRLVNNTEGDDVSSTLYYDASSRMTRVIFHEQDYTLYQAPGQDWPPPVTVATPFTELHIDIKDMPERLVLKGSFDSGGSPEADIGDGDFLTQFLNAIVGYFYKGFWGVGNTLRSISMRVFELPGGEGWVRLKMYNHDYASSYIGAAEFWYTGNRYIMVPEDRDGKNRGFMAFYNDYGSSVDVAVSGRLFGLSWLGASFGNDTHLEYRTRSGVGEQSFELLYCDPHDDTGAQQENASLTVWDLPRNLTLDIETTSFHVQASSGMIGDITFVSYFSGTYMMVNLTDIPNSVDVVQNSTLIELALPEPMGTVEFVIADDVPYMMDGAHVLLKREVVGGSVFDPEVETSISGRIYGLSNLRYEFGNRTSFSYNIGSSYPLYVSVDDELTETVAKAVINPLPANIELDIANLLEGNLINVPDVGEISDVTDFTRFLSAMASIGNEITQALSNVTQSTVDVLGDIGENDRFNYLTNKNLNIVASIQKGDVSGLEPTTWTHGVSMRREVVDGEEALDVKLYINGMPKVFDIITETLNETVDLQIDITQMDSAYDWILVDISGLMDKDIFLYINGIEGATNLNMDVNITSDPTPATGILQGDIVVNSSKPLGQLYLRMGSTNPIPSTLTVYLSNVPREGTFKYTITHDTDLDIEMSAPVQSMYYQLANMIEGEWYKLELMAVDLPTSFSLDVTANPEFDMDNLSPLQGFPTINLGSSGDTTDILLLLQGRVNGNRGDITVYAEDLPKGLDIWSKEEELNVKATDGKVKQALVRVENLPIRKEYQLDSLEIVASDVAHMKVSVNMRVSNLPIIRITDIDSGDVRIKMEHRLQIFGKERRAEVVFIDLAYGDGPIPSTGGLSRNEIAVDGSKNHIIFPEVVSTFMGTLLGG